MITQRGASAILGRPMVEAIDDIEQFFARNSAVARKGCEAALEFAQALFCGEGEYDGFVFLTNDLNAGNGVERRQALVARAQANLKQLPFVKSTHIFGDCALPSYVEALHQHRAMRSWISLGTDTGMTPRMAVRQRRFTPQVQVLIGHSPPSPRLVFVVIFACERGIEMRFLQKFPP